MSKNIHHNLRSFHNQCLFKAYSVGYDSAKSIQQVRFILTYLISIISPLISIYFINFRPIFSILGGIWAIIAFFITVREKNKIKEAAKIQDEFDTNVFELSKNEILVGSHISEWMIDELSKRYSGKANIETWYGNVSEIASSLDIIICQRSNVIWDWRLRKKYFLTLLFLLILLFAAGITVSLIFHLTLSQYISGVLLPAASAFILGIKELIEHYDNFSAKQKLESKLNGLIEKYKKENSSLYETLLRQIQDAIYLSRKCTALIPTWFYNLNKKSYNNRMQAVIDAVETVK